MTTPHYFPPPGPRGVRAAAGRPAAGFALTEILIGLAALAVIVAIALANFTNAFGGENRVAEAKTFVQSGLTAALKKYAHDTGKYPSTNEGLKALVTQPPFKKGWNGPYIEDPKILVDPWGDEYHYRFPGLKNVASYDLWSIGPDRINATEDDIGNW